MFTTQEKEIIDQLKAKGKSPQQIAGYIGGLRTNAPSAISRELGEEPKPFDESTVTRVAKDIPSDIIETGKRAFGATNEAGKGIVDTFKRDDIGLADKVVTAGSQAFKGIGRFIGETFLGAAKLTTTDNFEKQAAGAMTEVGESIAKTDFVQDTVAWYDSQDDNKKRQIQNILGYGEGLAELFGAGTAVKGIKAGVKGSKEAAAASSEAVTAALNDVVTLAKQGKPSKAIKIANESVDDVTREAAIDKLQEVYTSSMVENRQSINTKLDKLAQENSFGDKKATRDTLIRDLAKEGYVPQPEGRLANFQAVFDEIRTDQKKVMEAYEPLVKNTRQTIRLDEFENRIIKQVDANPQIGADYQKTVDEVKRIIESYRVNPRYGANKPAGEVDLNAEMINNIRKEMNSRFDNSDVSVSRSIFETDSDYAVGKASREWLDEAIPDEAARKANGEWARLNTLRQTAEVFHNQQIDVGVWGRALGSYMTTIGATAAGAAVGGPVAAVTIGILTKMGGDALADMLRKKAFSPEVVAQIRSTLKQSDDIVEQLNKTADQQSKDLIKDFLLEAPKEGAYRSSVSGNKVIEAGGLDADGKKVEPGLTERAEPGAIKTPTTTKFLQMQANKYKTPETFIAAVNSNKAWLQKFKDMGTTPEEIAKTAFAGRTAAMEANKQYIAQIGDKLVEDMVKNKSKQSVNSIVNQAKKDFAMTTEEAEMLRKHINDVTLGMLDNSTPSFKKSEISPTTKLYHGTNKPESIRSNGFKLGEGVEEDSSFLGDNIFEGIYLSKNKSPYEEGGQLEDVIEVMEVNTEASNILQVNFDEVAQLYKKYGINELSDTASKDLTKALQKEGYDGVEFGSEIVIFEPSKVKLK